MMPEINLLPWREQRREELRKQFLYLLGAFVLLGLVVVGLFWLVMTSAIDNQRSRNEYLTSQIQILEQQVKEIKGLKARKEKMLERMRIIQDLQGKRPVIVRVFDELARIIPDGVFFTELKRNGDRFDLRGVAESNNRVATLMRNLDKSEWFKEPNLSEVTANPEYGEQANNFLLSFRLAPPASPVDAAASPQAANGGTNGKGGK